jgi:hypothetical protein
MRIDTDLVYMRQSGNTTGSTMRTIKMLAPRAQTRRLLHQRDGSDEPGGAASAPVL